MEYELYHHGIKGMKWGKRRFQNPDGTLTNAGKRRYAQSIQKQAQGNTADERKKLVEDVRKDLVTNYKSALKSQVANIKDTKAKWLAMDTPENDYWDSGAAAKDSAKAYKKTLDWFEKNDKAFLNEIVKLNGGSKENLDMYHGFRKAYEGYQDVEWQQGEKRFYKERKIDRNTIDKAYDDYRNSCINAAKSVVGNYGNTPVSKTSSWVSNSNVQDIIESAIMNGPLTDFD